MPPPTPTDPVVHWTAPLYPAPPVLAPAAIPVETMADPSDPLRDGVGLAVEQLPPVDDLMQIAFDMPAASVASLATTVPSSELPCLADLEGGDDREARAFAREVPSVPALSATADRYLPTNLEPDPHFRLFRARTTARWRYSQ